MELEIESSIGRGDIGQASWLTLPVIVLLVTLCLVLINMFNSTTSVCITLS